VALQQPFAFNGVLQDAADQSLPQDPIPFNFSAQFTARSSGVLSLSGSGSQALPFGTIGSPGAKAIFIRYDGGQQGALPVLLTLNSDTVPEEITPGGMFALMNPNPTAGVTSASIAFTASCQIRYWIYG
jgi:hypothetical protein